VLQCVAKWCISIQCVAMYLSDGFVTEAAAASATAGVLQCVVACCSALLRVAVRCSVLQCVAACCSALLCVAVRCSVLHSFAVYVSDAVCCSVLQCTAVCCSVLQCVAVYCSVLQCMCLADPLQKRQRYY